MFSTIIKIVKDVIIPIIIKTIEFIGYICDTINKNRKGKVVLEN